jgi:hypothetical protein
MASDLAYYLDMTGGGTDRAAQEIRWASIDMPDETAAMLNSKTQKGAILHCRKGGSAVELYWPEEFGPAKAFRLGEHVFALTPATLVLSPDLKSLSGTVALNARLREALLGGGGKAGIMLADRTIAAVPRDVLQKFGLRCAALLKGEE